MFFEPQLMGKEPLLRIPTKGSSSKDLSLKEFRLSLREQAQSLNSWELLPQTFLKLLQEKSYSHVGIFIPKADWAEPKNIVTLSLELLAKYFPHTTLLGPKLSGDEMTFHRLSLDSIVAGPLGTQHIASDEKAVIPDLLLLPALACTLSGERLGRGKGYYDRYMAQNPQLTSCVVTHSSFLFDELPSHFFHKGDQKVHSVLTEKEFIKIKNGNEVQT
ncbi:MAG: 5-formyltetrahydrofolate cyclo-ligase [Bdellovibrionota bacterium]